MNVTAIPPLEYFLFKGGEVRWRGKNGPTTAELSDREVLQRLAQVEVRDYQARCRPLSLRQPVDRKGINLVHAALFQEALKRGLRRIE